MVQSSLKTWRRKAESLVEKAKILRKVKEKIAIIFPGQGAQKPGMALLLRPDTRERLFGVLREVLGRDPFFVERLIFLITFGSAALSAEERAARKKEIDALQAELNDTRYAQLAIFIVYCGWVDEREEDEAIPVPYYVLGLSLGEYIALYAAKIIDFKSGVLLVYARSQLMALASVSFGGGMLAVRHDKNIKKRDIAAALKNTDIVIANSFSSKKLTLSGDKEQLEGVRVALRGKGYAATFVPVSGAFHHPERMKLVEEGLKLVFAILDITLRNPKINLICNYSGNVEKDPNHIQNNLIHHVVGQVMLRASIELMARNGVARESVVVPFDDKTVIDILKDFKWPKGATEAPISAEAQLSS